MSVVITTTVPEVYGQIDAWFPSDVDAMIDATCLHVPIMFPFNGANQPRFFIIPLSLSDPSLVGIVCYYFGRIYWLTPTLSGPNYIMNFTMFDGIPQPAPNNPRVFKLESSSGRWTFKSVAYSSGGTNRYIYANNSFVTSMEGKDNSASDSDKGESEGVKEVGALYPGDLILSSTLDDLRRFDLQYQVGNGPLIPWSENDIYCGYYLMTSQGKALVASTTAPYLSWTTLNFSDNNQKFAFHAESVPDPYAPYAPYLYSMRPFHHQETIYSFTDTNQIETRTVVGPWEKLIVEAGSQSTLFTTYRFTISGSVVPNRLRANTTPSGSLSLVDQVNGLEDEDYFYAIPLSLLGMEEMEKRDAGSDTRVIVSVTTVCITLLVAVLVTLGARYMFGPITNVARLLLIGANQNETGAADPMPKPVER